MEAAVIRRTQETLGKVIRKPPLTDKLLGKPPFRYLHDVLTEVIRTTSFLKGLYTESELKSDNVKDKDSKISFLQKAIDVVGLVIGEPLPVKPARIVAGHEPEKTNEFLQAIGKCCLNKLSSDDAVKRVLTGEKLEPKGKPPSSTKSQDKENREAKDEERRSQREKEDKRESEIRERSGSKDRQQLKDEEKKHSEREKKKERERVGETEKDGLREGEKNDREKNRIKESRSETDKDKNKEKGGDRERRSEGSHGKERDRTRDKEKVRDREREHEKERNLEKERDPEDRSRERDRDRGDRNRDERTRTREQDKERRRERDLERRKERVRENEHQGDRKEKPEEVRSERKHKTSEESAKKSSDTSARESKHDAERELSVSSKASRPSASKLRERRPAKLSGEGDSASDGEAEDAEIQNKENNDASDMQTNISAQRRIPRPGSARPAPPRVKRHPSIDVIVPERASSGKGVSSVIVEKQKDDGGDDDDNEFVVEEASPQLSDMPAMEMESELDGPASEKHGSLVKKILETKKDYETQADAVSKDKTLLTDNGRKKEKDMVTKEIEKFRSSIQIVCRSALPLGKIMDYIQEDMDTMQNERQTWRKENGEHAEVLLREQSITDSAVEPLKAELAELEQLIKEQRDRICTVKGNILRNEEKIQKMVQSMSGSSID